MPTFGFSDQEIRDLVTFLAEEYIDPDLQIKTAEKQVKMIGAADVNRGKELISQYGCTGCHEIDGVEDLGEIGFELTTISDVHRSKIDFGVLKVSYKDRTVPNWLYNKMKNPRAIGLDPKMPDFGFSDGEAQAMTTYLMSLNADEVANFYKLTFGNRPSNYDPQGEFGKILDKYQCFTCHKIMGKGADHAPDLTAEGSRIQQGWLQKYLKETYGIRPTAHERMPNFRLSDSEIDSIYSYFRTALIDDRVEALSETVGKIDFDESTGEAGRKLYYEKYACIACHRINSKGGIIGPDLSRVGDRLRPEWIAYHLRDPKAFVTKSPEPVYNFTENEIRELTAFLVNQKEKD
jgi:mono/diheme cytochrome c family protein